MTGAESNTSAARSNGRRRFRSTPSRLRARSGFRARSSDERPGFLGAHVVRFQPRQVSGNARDSRRCREPSTMSGNSRRRHWCELVLRRLPPASHVGPLTRRLPTDGIGRTAARGASRPPPWPSARSGGRRAGHHRSDRQLPGRRVVRRRAGSSGRVIATPVDVGQFVAQGSVLVRIQGVDAGLRLDEARAAAARAEANVKLAESQNTLAQTTAQRYAALLATATSPETVADQARTQAETASRASTAARASLAAGPGAARAGRKGGRRRRRRRAVRRLHQPAPRVARRVRAAVDRGRDAAEDRPAAAAADHSRRAGRPGRASGRPVTARSTPSRARSSRARSARSTRRSPPNRARSWSRRACRNPEARLKPGMFAVATIDQGRTERALLVPKRAVIEDVNTNSFRVFVVDKENRARLRVVQLAARQQPETHQDPHRRQGGRARRDVQPGATSTTAPRSRQRRGRWLMPRRAHDCRAPRRPPGKDHHAETR